MYKKEKMDLKKAVLIIIYMICLLIYGLNEFNINYLFGFMNPICYMYILKKEEGFTVRQRKISNNIFYSLVTSGFIGILLMKKF